MSRSTQSIVALAAEFHQRYPEEWLNALADERRLLLVETLRSTETPVEKEELARRIATHEAGQSPSGVDDAAVRDVHIALHHNHLPRLADLGIIDYAEKTGTIEELHIHEDIQLLEA